MTDPPAAVLRELVRGGPPLRHLQRISGILPSTQQHWQPARENVDLGVDLDVDL